MMRPMARKGSAGTRALRAALRELQDAVEHGRLPEQAPEGLGFGQYAGLWVTPDRKVFARSEQAPGRGGPGTVRVIVDPCGCGATNTKCGLEYLPEVAWDEAAADRLGRAQWWRAADGSWLAVD